MGRGWVVAWPTTAWHQAANIDCLRIRRHFRPKGGGETRNNNSTTGSLQSGALLTLLAEHQPGSRGPEFGEPTTDCVALDDIDWIATRVNRLACTRRHSSSRGEHTT